MSTPRRYLGQFSERRENNFDFIRLILASIVILTHSFVIMKTGLPEPLEFVTRKQLSFGALAVDGFFVISGFLIAASWFRSRGLADYFRKRVLRIHPGFIVCCFFCVFVVGPLGQPSTVGYFRSVDWFAFVKNAVFLNKIDLPPDWTLLRGFDTRQINGSIWTIKIEFECYVCLAALGFLGWLKRPWVPVAVLGVTWPLYVIHLIPGIVMRLPAPELIQHFGAHWRFLTYFLLGTATYGYRARIPHDVRIFAFACALFVIGSATGTGTVLMPPAICYVVFFVAFHPAIRLHGVAEKRDLSYGIYLYGWPIQYVWMLVFGRQMNPYLFFLLCLPTAALCALASWNLVEAPCLALKGRAPRAQKGAVQAAASAVAVAPADSPRVD